MTLANIFRGTAVDGALLLRCRHGLASFVGQHPSIYLPPARLKHRWDTFVRPSVRGYEIRTRTRHPWARLHIVIEGYPRSANSFAVAAFRLAQPRFMHIAHHRHGYPCRGGLLSSCRASVAFLIRVRSMVQIHLGPLRVTSCYAYSLNSPSRGCITSDPRS